ncbi:MAG: tetraacyldisaccharide 4'-kinase [bacterium]
MFENFWYQTVSSKKKSLLQFVFYVFLLFISIFYGLGLFLRKKLYQYNILKAKSFGVKIISAGNITMGGTGKTPFIEEIAKRLISEEKSVVIVCKGYKRNKKQPLNVVSDGIKILLKQENAGDEAFMLARSVQKAKVIVADDKLMGIAYAVKLFNPDYVLLDDGFQKRGDIAKAKHCVLIDAINPVGFGRLFPAGMLREPMSEIKHADAVIITNTNLVEPEKIIRIKQMIRSFNIYIMIYESEHHPKIVYNISNAEKFDPDVLDGKKIIAFSSIGNPLGFEKTLKALGANMIIALRFRDHHKLSKKEMGAIIKLYDRTQASMILTTEKDEVKIDKKYVSNSSVYALKIGMLIKNIKQLEAKLTI